MIFQLRPRGRITNNEEGMAVAADGDGSGLLRIATATSPERLMLQCNLSTGERFVISLTPEDAALLGASIQHYTSRAVFAVDAAYPPPPVP